ncbi:hypothetical protein [Halobacillus mangrovi]|uniref:Uncharacterized protein n=1 Tax=Halobacillus mangrovi TaxID=402384 RepID=A0A1W5ZZL2_9BACI|nr:hypothetical protein [Halobacillus mangrovi]ARI78805.1 hypothetical protein HM131_19050 [Halobacillus mangrovi]
MIEISFTVSKNVKIIVNKVLEEISDCFLSICEDSGDFHIHLPYLFPPHLIRNEYDKCKKIVYDILDFTKDDYPHTLSPLYEYVLYHLIDWYIDVSDEVSDEQTFFDPSNLQALSEDDEFIIRNINDLDTYKYFMFEDHDFLDVGDFVSIYLLNPQAIKHFNIDLKEYIDLMPYDIQDKVLKKGEFKVNNTKEKIEELIVRVINYSIKQVERDPLRLETTKETHLSDDIANFLRPALSKEGIITAREQPSGFAIKSSGELDFFIYSQSDHTYHSIAIGENKEWGNFQKHFKQLLGYMNEDTEFGFTIIFNKSTNLRTVLKKREEYIKNIYVEVEGVRYFETINLIKGYKGDDKVLISTHLNPEDSSIFKVYHFIVNAYRPERKESARQARNKKKI